MLTAELKESLVGNSNSVTVKAVFEMRRLVLKHWLTTVNHGTNWQKTIALEIYICIPWKAYPNKYGISDDSSVMIHHGSVSLDYSMNIAPMFLIVCWIELKIGNG